jgi:MFS family permease
MDPQRRRALLGLAAISLLHGLVHTYSTFLSPLNEEVRRYFGASSITAITSFKTTYLFFYSLSNLFFGAFTHRISARWTLALGIALNGAAVFGFSFVGSGGLPGMHVLWAIGALGGGTYHPVASVLITRIFPKKKGWALGVAGMGASAGFAFGPLASGFLAGPLGLDWQNLAQIFGLAGLLYAGIVVACVRDPLHLPAARPSRGKSDGAGRGFVLFVFLLMLASGLREITMWSVMDISDFFLTRAHGEALNSAWFISLMFLPGVLAQPVAGFLSDRGGRDVLAAAALFLGAGATFALSWSPGWLLALPYLAMGLGQTASVPIIEAIAAEHTDERRRGLIFGFLVTAGMGMGAAGPLLSGLFVDSLGGTVGAYRTVISLLAGLTALGGAVLLLSRRVATGIQSRSEAQ